MFELIAISLIAVYSFNKLVWWAAGVYVAERGL